MGKFYISGNRGGCAQCSLTSETNLPIIIRAIAHVPARSGKFLSQEIADRWRKIALDNIYPYNLPGDWKKLAEKAGDPEG